MRVWYGVLAAAMIAALALYGCSFKYPSCSPAKVRDRDGALCAECVDAKGTYSECTAVVGMER